MRRHPRAKRLQVIASMAAREEEKLLNAWGQLQQRLAQEEEQRQQLELYRLEYQQKISSPSTQAVSAGFVHNALGFMAQIDQALNAQLERLNLLRKQVEVARQQYLAQRGRVKALVGLMDKLDVEYDAEQEKIQQKQSDEWANRAANLRMKR